MSTEINLELVRQWVEQVWNAGDLEALRHFHPPTFANHGNPSTIEEAQQWHRQQRSTFPDLHYTIDDLWATADRVALRWRATATHQGTLWNLIPATGKTITWNGMHLLRIVNGQIVEVWAVQNTVAQLQQMGVTLHPAETTIKPALRTITPLLPAGKSLADALAFYTQQMGFTVVWQGGGMAGIRRDDSTFNLVENDNQEWANNTSFSIGVSDLDALYAEYRPIAAQVGPLEMKAWGRREFHMIVPPGVAFQFYQQ